MNRSIKVFGSAAAVVVIAVLVIVGGARAQDATPEPVTPYPVNTITVVGTGVARGEPDIATVELGVETFNTSVGEAFAQANTALENVVNTLTALGIAPEDIYTSNLSVYNSPRFNPETGTEERGYTVSNTVRVTVRDVAQIEAVIDAAISAGATQLYGLTFNVDDRTALETDARAAAFANAQVRAQEYAALIGAELGEVVVVAENVYGGAIPFAADMAQSEGRGGGGAFVQPGQTEVQIQVQVTYRIVR